MPSRECGEASRGANLGTLIDVGAHQFFVGRERLGMIVVTTQFARISASMPMR
jgi:hypothetical protein